MNEIEKIIKLKKSSMGYIYALHKNIDVNFKTMNEYDLFFIEVEKEYREDPIFSRLYNGIRDIFRETFILEIEKQMRIYSYRDMQK